MPSCWRRLLVHPRSWWVRFFRSSEVPRTVLLEWSRKFYYHVHKGRPNQLFVSHIILFYGPTVNVFKTSLISPCILHFTVYSTFIIFFISLLHLLCDETLICICDTKYKLTQNNQLLYLHTYLFIIYLLLFFKMVVRFSNVSRQDIRYQQQILMMRTLFFGSIFYHSNSPQI